MLHSSKHSVDDNPSMISFASRRLSSVGGAMLVHRNSSPPPVQYIASQWNHAPPPEPLTRSSLPLSSVVLIECTSAAPSFISPWRYRDQQATVGSGFAVEQHRIMTNAHVVRGAVRIRVQRFGSAEKYAARVVAMGLECDLALIEIIERNAAASPDVPSGFWADLPPLQWAESGVPELYDSVSVIGFPAGGQTICVTKGVVSRIDTQAYNRFSSSSLLIAQIDAAINPGNSGGPALDNEGRVAGVAFLKRTTLDADNIGYIIPATVARNFLHTVEKNTLAPAQTPRSASTSVPGLGFEYQSLDNPSLRRSAGMSDAQTGVLVVRVAPLGALGRPFVPDDEFEDPNCDFDPGQPLLRVGDIILRVDAHVVANDGSVLFRRNEMLTFEHLITCKAEGTTTFGLLRQGREVEIRAELGPVPSPAPLIARAPTYFIIGGLVFTKLTGPLVEEYINGNTQSVRISEAIIKRGFAEMKTREDSEVVLLLRILAHEINYGYGSRNCLVVDTLNGRPVRNFADLVAQVRECTESFLRFEFCDTARRIVLETVAARNAEAEILQMHGIPSACSPDLRLGVAGPGAPTSKEPQPPH